MSSLYGTFAGRLYQVIFVRSLNVNFTGIGWCSESNTLHISRPQLPAVEFYLSEIKRKTFVMDECSSQIAWQSVWFSFKNAEIAWTKGCISILVPQRSMKSWSWLSMIFEIELSSIYWTPEWRKGSGLRLAMHCSAMRPDACFIQESHFTRLLSSWKQPAGGNHFKSFQQRWVSTPHFHRNLRKKYIPADGCLLSTVNNTSSSRRSPVKISTHWSKTPPHL